MLNWEDESANGSDEVPLSRLSMNDLRRPRRVAGYFLINTRQKNMYERILNKSWGRGFLRILSQVPDPRSCNAHSAGMKLIFVDLHVSDSESEEPSQDATPPLPDVRPTLKEPVITIRAN